MAKRSDKAKHRMRRHWRVRSRIRGTPDRPRLSVFRSNKYVYAQVIDDEAGRTLAAASTLQKGLREQAGDGAATLAAAQLVGRTVAERAKEKGVARVAFDRGGYRYHGRVKALADAAREAGLEF